MKKRNTAIIFAAVLIAAFSLTSCAGREYYLSGNAPVSQAPVAESSAEASVEESNKISAKNIDKSV